jgi:hypothetical protein
MMGVVKDVKKVLPSDVADEAGRKLAALLHAEWIPSCIRESTLAPPSAWEEMMLAYGLGQQQNLYMVKPLAWKSEKVGVIGGRDFLDSSDHFTEAPCGGSAVQDL